MCGSELRVDACDVAGPIAVCRATLVHRTQITTLPSRQRYKHGCRMQNGRKHAHTRANVHTHAMNANTHKQRKHTHTQNECRRTIAPSHVDNHWRDPNRIEAHRYDVVQLIHNARECACTTQAGVSIHIKIAVYTLHASPTVAHHCVLVAARTVCGSARGSGAATLTVP